MDESANLLAAIPAPALLIGRTERLLALNEGARALLRNAEVGRHYVTALRQPAVLAAIDAALGGAGPRQAEYFAREEGREATYEAHAAAAGGAVLVTFLDRTERRATEQMRRDFVANLSHELRTPLTALLGFIETLRGPAHADAAARERFLAVMDAEARRMERLVRDLLSLNRVEQSERMRPEAPVELGALVRSAAQALAPVAQAAGHAIAAELAAAPAVVRGDADQLAQVLANLVENALKYGGDTVLRLELAAADPVIPGPVVRIVVEDRGEGIDPVHLPRLTERFYRVDTHRARGKGGTGLGLAIVKHIVGRHRGRLAIESVPGEGSRFTVVLPREAG